jgi:hypothetical protein
MAKIILGVLATITTLVSITIAFPIVFVTASVPEMAIDYASFVPLFIGLILIPVGLWIGFAVAVKKDKKKPMILDTDLIG